MASSPDLDPTGIAGLGATLTRNIRRAVKVSDDVVRDLIVALQAEGHVLIEDHPGVGKTALARSLGRSLDAEYARVQCTADLLPPVRLVASPPSNPTRRPQSVTLDPPRRES